MDIQKRETHYVDDTGLADFYYNGNEMFVAGIGNFKEGKEDDGYIYDIALETDDCSIGGITPNVSSKDDVLKNTGNPQKSTFLRSVDYTGIFTAFRRVIKSHS